jgi:adenosylhomocysteine nucleosidase
LERELRPLLRRSERIRSTPEFAFYEFRDAVAVCGGIGKAAAARAARALIAAYRPSSLVSAGFAGAVQPELNVGDLVVPAEILDLDTQQTFRLESGRGVLATTAEIASKNQKAGLASQSICAIDMEASAVAREAQQHGMRFLAIKAISDTADFEMPAMNRFIDDGGRFRLAAFLTHVALRPAMWPRVRKLAANSARAAFVLSEALDTLLREGRIGKTQVGAIVRVDA